MNQPINNHINQGQPLQTQVAMNQPHLHTHLSNQLSLSRQFPVKPVGFLDSYLTNNRFEFQKPTPEILSKWADLRQSADAHSTMLVSTNSWNKNHNDSKIHTNSSCNENEWNGQPRLMTCVLCQEHLFIFNYTAITANSNVGINNHTEHSMSNRQNQPQNYFSLPNYYIVIEFARMQILRNEHTGHKCGFSLQIKDVIHEFRIPTAVHNNSKQSLSQNSCAANVKHNRNSNSEQECLENSLNQNENINKEQKNPNSTNQQNYYNTLQKQQQQHEPCDDPREVKFLLKQWVSALNVWVVRCENLKKYSVLGQIGAGAQAKVYKITRKKESVQQHVRNQGQQIVGKLENPLNSQQDPNKISNRDADKNCCLPDEQQNLNEQDRQVMKEKQIFAIKVISKEKLLKKNQVDQRQMINEIQIQRNLRLCGNIIRLNKIYESDKYLNLMMDYQEGGTLGDLLEKQIQISEEDTRVIIAQILLTVDFMSRKGIIHRDLKPENILLNSKQQGVYDVRIADFGFSIPLNNYTPEHDKLLKILCGTPGYIAPEALHGNGFQVKSDVFSVGSILYSVLTLKNLFNGNTYKEIMEANKACNLQYINYDLYKCSPEARDLLRLLLQKDPNNRPTAIQALAHPWFFNEKLPLQSSVQINKYLTNANFPAASSLVMMNTPVDLNERLNTMDRQMLLSNDAERVPSKNHNNIAKQQIALPVPYEPNSISNDIGGKNCGGEGGQGRVVSMNQRALGRNNISCLLDNSIQNQGTINNLGINHFLFISNRNHDQNIAKMNQQNAQNFREQQKRGISVNICQGSRRFAKSPLNISGVSYHSPAINQRNELTQFNYYTIISEYKRDLQSASQNRSQSPHYQFSGNFTPKVNNIQTSQQYIGGAGAPLDGSRFQEQSLGSRHGGAGFSAALTQKNQMQSYKHQGQDHHQLNGHPLELNNNFTQVNQATVRALNHTLLLQQQNIERTLVVGQQAPDYLHPQFVQDGNQQLLRHQNTHQVLLDPNLLNTIVENRNGKNHAFQPHSKNQANILGNWLSERKVKELSKNIGNLVQIFPAQSQNIITNHNDQTGIRQGGQSGKNNNLGLTKSKFHPSYNGASKEVIFQDVQVSEGDAQGMNNDDQLVPVRPIIFQNQFDNSQRNMDFQKQDLTQLKVINNVEESKTFQIQSKLVENANISEKIQLEFLAGELKQNIVSHERNNINENLNSESINQLKNPSKIKDSDDQKTVNSKRLIPYLIKNEQQGIQEQQSNQFPYQKKKTCKGVGASLKNIEESQLFRQNHTSNLVTEKDQFNQKDHLLRPHQNQYLIEQYLKEVPQILEKSCNNTANFQLQLSNKEQSVLPVPPLLQQEHAENQDIKLIQFEQMAKKNFQNQKQLENRVDAINGNKYSSQDAEGFVVMINEEVKQEILKEENSEEIEDDEIVDEELDREKLRERNVTRELELKPAAGVALEKLLLCNVRYEALADGENQISKQGGGNYSQINSKSMQNEPSQMGFPDEIEDDMLSPETRWAHLQKINQPTEVHEYNILNQQNIENVGAQQIATANNQMKEVGAHHKPSKTTKIILNEVKEDQIFASNNDNNTSNINNMMENKRFMKGLNVAKSKRVFL